MNFNFNLPVNLIFGPGSINQIGAQTKKYGKHALIVTGRSSTKRTGLLKRVIDLLASEGILTTVFDKVPANPTVSEVDEGTALAKHEGCDVIIGLGGGSSMDCAKAIAFSAVNTGPIMEYVYGKHGEEALPVILATTTAGTGSEGDSIAVLTDPETKDKKGLKKTCLYPVVSIIDPELMTTLPPRIIASTGFDALCHCIEAYVSNQANPLSEMLALEGIRLISESVVKVYHDPSDVASWEPLCLGNTLGGMVIDMAGVALAHGMEHPLSGLLNVTHGQGLAALMPAFMQFNLDARKDKYTKIAQAMGASVDGLSTDAAAGKAIEVVDQLRKDLKLNINLTDLGVKEHMLDWMTENTIKVSQPGIMNNPVEAQQEDIYKLFSVSM